MSLLKDDDFVSEMFKYVPYFYLDTWTYESFIDNIPSIDEYTRENMRTAKGASKLCIWWENDLDYVLKIPYCRAAGYTQSAYSQSPTENLFDQARNQFNDWDYCRTEVEIYNHSKIYGLDYLFLSIEPVNLNLECSAPIYRQVRATTPEACYQGRLSELQEQDRNSVVSSGDSLRHRRIDLDMMALVCSHYGSETLVDFIHFLEIEERINDLHNENLGYRYNDLVIFDYSGYREGS